MPFSSGWIFLMKCQFELFNWVNSITVVMNYGLLHIFIWKRMWWTWLKNEKQEANKMWILTIKKRRLCIQLACIVTKFGLLMRFLNFPDVNFPFNIICIFLAGNYYITKKLVESLAFKGNETMCSQSNKILTTVSNYMNHKYPPFSTVLLVRIEYFDRLATNALIKFGIQTFNKSFGTDQSSFLFVSTLSQLMQMVLNIFTSGKCWIKFK